jgi:hypothetical protein
MPAQAGIQAVIKINNFIFLVSRFRGKDGVARIVTQSQRDGRRDLIPDAHIIVEIWKRSPSSAKRF